MQLYRTCCLLPTSRRPVLLPLLCPAGDGQGDEPVPDSALINFKGQAALTAAAKKTVAANATVKGTAVHCDAPRASMTRLRFINCGGFAVFNVSIDNHRLVAPPSDCLVVAGIQTVAASHRGQCCSKPCTQNSL
jgi:hypothetical protein